MHIGLPTLTVEPQTLDVEITQCARLTANVSGVGKERFEYQWKRNGSDMTGETKETLEFVCTAKNNGGIYECAVQNEYGDSKSSTAEVKVTSKNVFIFLLLFTMQKIYIQYNYVRVN